VKNNIYDRKNYLLKYSFSFINSSLTFINFTGHTNLQYIEGFESGTWGIFQIKIEV